MKVWLFQTGEPIHTDEGNYRPMRAINLSNALIERGHQVVLWTSSFFHTEKKHRSKKFKSIVVNENLTIKLIPSSGYKRNIGLGRIIDHIHLSFNIYNRINKETSFPDVAFVGYPPIETSYRLIKWLNRNKIPSIIDVKDLWPEMFIDKIPAILKPIAKLLLYPFYFMGRSAIKNSTGVTSMADGFLNWTIQFSGKKNNQFNGVFPLTSEIGQVSEEELSNAKSWCDKNGIIDNENFFRICFIGSFMSVFDFKPIKDCALKAQDEKIPLQFVLCGDGDYLEEVKLLMKDLNNIIFPGWVDRSKIKIISQRSNVAIAPYLNIDNFKNNLPNKIIDSLSLGLPILSPLEGEVKKLINENKVGLSYDKTDNNNLYCCINQMISNKDMLNTFSENSLKIYKKNFHFKTVYPLFVKHLEKTSNFSI